MKVRGGSSRKKSTSSKIDQQLVERLVKKVIEDVDIKLELIPAKCAKVTRVVHCILVTA